VPLGEAGRIVGSFGLRGTGHFTALQQEALQFVAHSLFAQFRSLHDEEVGNGKAALTRREREVIRLSAEGMTSVQIAKMLGMSARTANQHFDNVADKLGTRNRAHTVAEVIRRGLLE
jgi:DNA-binding CsgD family transcriptional regulator